MLGAAGASCRVHVALSACAEPSGGLGELSARCTRGARTLFPAVLLCREGSVADIRETRLSNGSGLRSEDLGSGPAGTSGRCGRPADRGLGGSAAKWRSKVRGGPSQGPELPGRRDARGGWGTRGARAHAHPLQTHGTLPEPRICFLLTFSGPLLCVHESRTETFKYERFLQ